MPGTNPGENYLQVVRDQLCKLGDDLLTEDIDILCQYVVLRFLKTSPHAHKGASPQENQVNLDAFVQDIYPFLVTFVTMVNSLPLETQGGEA